jgi:hypothetical protein
LLSAVPVYETSRRKQTMLKVVRDHELEPPAGTHVQRGHVAHAQEGGS